MILEKENYHLHTTISDGKLKPEELIKLAIKKKFSTICITDHYHLPPKFRGEKNDFYSEKDYRLLNRLKNKYSGKINVLAGVEFDWLGDYKEWFEKEAKKKYDLRLLSIHFIKAKKDYIPLDLSEELFNEAIKKSGGIEKAVRSYYHDLREGINTGYFDAVAHMDIIKIWNKNKKYFSGNENWHKKEVIKTLKLIKTKNMKMEINTAGWRKPCNEQYPAEWILRKAVNLGIPILIGTDGHRKEQIDYKLKEANDLLEKLK